MELGRLPRRAGPTFRAVLDQSLSDDPYTCEPDVDELFFGPGAESSREIAGVVSHYGWFAGPMAYRIHRSPDTWRVELDVGVVLPEHAERIELTSCAAPASRCTGEPYTSSPTTDVCPAIGDFSARYDRRGAEVLLARWSRDIEVFYNRDARHFELPITYDITFRPYEADTDHVRPHIVLPLETTCGRTPYFASIRSGWSDPVVAHEMGHVLGLIDEYEMLSGIVSFYPKTPFVGAEISRMGLSMKPQTRFLPLHHYLVLRRFACAEPDAVSRFERPLMP